MIRTMISAVRHSSTSSSSMAMEYGRVHDFWFGSNDEKCTEFKFSLWYPSGEAGKLVDENIKSTFGKDVESAMAGGLSEWEQDPRGALCKVLLLDQFTRSIYRKNSKAFAADPEARRVARVCVDTFDDYHPLERAFVTLPFSHSEDQDDQGLCIELNERNVALCTGAEFEAMSKESLRFALDHRKIVERFGRYPHRNAVLNRTSTAEELEYLETAERYGQ